MPNTMNQLTVSEYGPNNLQFGRAHNKQSNIGNELYYLEHEQSLAYLENYNALGTKNDFVLVLKEGLKLVQAQLKR